MKLGLAAIDAVCERLGRPERRVPAILVAGTNGKGSTAATLSAIARACGIRAGLYTSPHLSRVTERIRVEEEDVSEEDLDRVLGRVFEAADRAPEIPVTYFEAMTAAAFAHFAARDLDLAVLEVGLGGRFDATNVAPARVSVVTSIGLDHTEELGPTVVSVAREKAGIFRRDFPALARACEAGAREALRTCAAATGAIFHDAGQEMRVAIREVGLEGTEFEVSTPERRARLSTPLPGAHQAWNAALALRAVELLDSPRIPLTPESLREGIASVRWPGRLEKLSIGNRAVLLDGCHNPAAASSLAGFLQDAGLVCRFDLVFGAMADKDIEGMARLLFPAARGVTLVTAPSPRAATASELSARVGAFARSAVEKENVREALAALLAREGEEPIIVAGSLYLVGEAREWLLAGGTSKGPQS